MKAAKTWQPLTALLLAFCVCSATAQAPALSTAELDTSALSFYGFYGFYGVNQGPDMSCGIVKLSFNLYNYGAQDLTYVSTIQYIIEQTKAAIDLTYLEARPAGSTSDYSVDVTELSAQFVTYVVVTVEVDFSKGENGGAFAAFLGLTQNDMSSGTSLDLNPAPVSGVFSIGVDFGVSDADFELLSTNDNEFVAFSQSVTSAFQAAVVATVSAEAAENVSVEIIGLSDDSGSEHGVGVIVRAYVHFGSNAAAGAAFLELLKTEPYSLGNKWGTLSEKITIAEANDVTSERMEAATMDMASSSSESSTRRLLQNGAVGTLGENALSRNIAASGLGVNSIPVDSLECLTPQVSSFYGFYGTDGSSVISSVNVNVPSADPRTGSSVVATGSSVVADGSSVVEVVSSAEFYGTTSFYGTSFYGTSFYGTSFYGEDVGTSAAGASSGATADSSVGGLSFYGYAPVSPSKPSTSSQPSRPSEPSRPQPSSPPPSASYPVEFTTIISDYNMEDIASPEDRAAFEESYIEAVSNALNMLGITSNPSIEIMDITAGSVAVDTKTTFNNAVDAQLFQEVLVQNPSLAFPAFSALGSVTITMGDNQAAAPPTGPINPTSPETQPETEPETPSQFCTLDKEGACCFSPGLLDASKTCCYEVVDACGVCGGNGDSCATEFIVRVTVPADAPAGRPSLEEVAAQIAADMEVPVSQISLKDSSEEVMSSSAGPIYSYVATVAPPAPSVQAIVDALAMLLSKPFPTSRFYISGVDAVERVGVCGNGICELREIDMCESDCSGVVSKEPITDRVTENEAPVNPASAGNNTTGLVVGIVAAVVGACIIAGVVYYLMVVRKKASAAREDGLASAQPIPASDIPQGSGTAV